MSGRLSFGAAVPVLALLLLCISSTEVAAQDEIAIERPANGTRCGPHCRRRSAKREGRGPRLTGEAAPPRPDRADSSRLPMAPPRPRFPPQPSPPPPPPPPPHLPLCKAGGSYNPTLGVCTCPIGRGGVDCDVRTLQSCQSRRKSWKVQCMVKRPQHCSCLAQCYAWGAFREHLYPFCFTRPDGLSDVDESSKDVLYFKWDDVRGPSSERAPPSRQPAALPPPSHRPPAALPPPTRRPPTAWLPALPHPPTPASRPTPKHQTNRLPHAPHPSRDSGLLAGPAAQGRRVAAGGGGHGARCRSSPRDAARVATPLP